MARSAFWEGFREGYYEGVLLGIVIVEIMAVVWLLNPNGATP